MNRVLRISVLVFLVYSVAVASVDSEVKARADEFAALWNKHDVKAMAEMWAPDGDVINPAGRVAKGRAEIEKLFRDEHGSIMKKSTYKNGNPSVRTLEPELAIGDWDCEITGMVAPDGKALPAQKTHVTAVMKKASGKWWLVSARAFNFVAPPPMAH